MAHYPEPPQQQSRNNQGLLCLRAYSEHGDPHHVSVATGLMPTKTITAGDPSHFPELGPIPSNGWFFEVDFSHDIAQASETIARTFRRWHGCREAILGLTAVGWDVDIVLTPPAEAPYLGLSPDVCRLIADIGVPLILELWPHRRYDTSAMP